MNTKLSGLSTHFLVLRGEGFAMVPLAGLVRTLLECLFGSAQEQGDVAMGDFPFCVPSDLLFEWFLIECSFLAFWKDL